ncbi:switch-activating protein Sap1 [Dionaea muscipula]
MRPILRRHCRPLKGLRLSLFIFPSLLPPTHTSHLISSKPTSLSLSTEFSSIFDYLFSLSKLVFHMAQKTEKEETEFKVAESTLTLCVNDCGFTGNPATNNMCQKCFKTASSSTGSILPPPHKASGSETSRSTSSRSPERPPQPFPAVERRDLKDQDPTAADDGAVVETTQAAAPVVREVNRCSGCRRKVGLTGFRCRCGELFCGQHRYSDRHDCSYDYKSVGREAIVRENPVVKAAKIVKL